MTANLYCGTAYRSVAFGTWSVGDASRHFEEKKKCRSSGGGEGINLIKR
ncbi:unnamed protein product [Meloidogyne enterolobii]|uniref:Uncharacterized protein n=1 Tax=Meloidogyne enterolobii TaxID=390850 RepID=A0ACB1ARK0_MELEN